MKRIDSATTEGKERGEGKGGKRGEGGAESRENKSKNKNPKGDRVRLSSLRSIPSPESVFTAIGLSTLSACPSPARVVWK